jgi:hypothetical protein
MLRGLPTQSHPIGVLAEPLLNLLQHSLLLWMKQKSFARLRANAAATVILD